MLYILAGMACLCPLLALCELGVQIWGKLENKEERKSKNESTL